MRPRRVLLAVLGGLLGVAPLGAAPTAPADDLELRGRAAVLEAPLPTQLGQGARPRPLGTSLTLGSATFAVERKGGGALLGPAPGAPPSLAAVPGRSVTLAWEQDGAPRRVRLGFVAAPEGAVAWFASEVRRFRVADTTLTLLDGDGDGRYGDPATDAWAIGEAGFALPHVPTAVLGRRRLTFLSIAPDGLTLRARVEPVAGTEPQLAGLEALNRVRALDGLLPCDLDAELCRRATLHARYLALNRWTGLTDPHAEQATAPGYTPEGDEIARLSNISKHPAAESVAGSWRTWYHRTPLIDPEAHLVGFGDDPGITVHPFGPARAWPAGERPAWRLPVSSPADGATEIPTAFEEAGELPQEPVPDARRRGFPLLLHFPPGHGFVFGGVSLEALRGKRSVPVPVTVGDPWRYPHVVGAVPDAPLEPGTEHRATFRWTEGGAERSLAIRFRTAGGSKPRR